MIELYDHNQKDYEAMCAMLEERGRVCLVKPPSDGKAILGMHLAEEHPAKLFLWVNPNVMHMEAQKSNAIRQSKKGKGRAHDFSNVVTMTYQGLLAIADNGTLPVLDRDEPDRELDYIIIDEFHHAGAPRWGEGVEALLAAYPEAKLIGFTATPIRFQEAGRDMAEELFGEDIAVNRSVLDAWADPDHPLVPPTYIRTYYSKVEELENIDKLRAAAAAIPDAAAKRRDKALADIERLAKYVEEADGVDEVMRKRITEPDAKAIVFCKNKDHLDELAAPDKVQEWFGSVNSDVHAYIIESTRSDCAEQLLSYAEDDSAALKVLYCIDMVNESLHVRGCRYAIMARPTESPVIWLQQMGRVFERDEQGRPGVIIDLARNFLRADGYIANMNSKSSKSVFDLGPIGQSLGKSRIYDQLAKPAELVDAIQRNLTPKLTLEESIDYWLANAPQANRENRG